MKQNLSTIFFTILLLSLVSYKDTKAQTPQYVDKILAKIGKGKIILQSELDQNFNQYKSENPSISDTVKCALLQEMIYQKLLVEQAERDSVMVSDEAVEANMENRIRYFINLAGSQEKLEQQMGRTVFQMKEDNRASIKEMMLAEEMKNQILKSVKITPNEVKKYFETIPTDSLPFFPASVELGQIVIEPKASEEMEVYARKKIEDIRKQIVEGSSLFETMAGIYSVDPGSRDQGGDLGWVQKGQMVPEFEKAGFKLQINEISPITKTEYGFHIIKCLGRQGDKVHLSHILIRPERTSADYKAAMLLLDSIRAELISGKITFQIAVGKYSNDKASKMTGGMLTDMRTGNPRMQIKDLDPTMALSIDSLVVGGYSQPQTYTNPQTGDKACRIIYLKSRNQPHKANLIDDYSNIQEVALKAKQMEEQSKWLKEKLPSFYLKIDKSYQDCPELAPWVSLINKGNR